MRRELIGLGLILLLTMTVTSQNLEYLSDKPDNETSSNSIWEFMKKLKSAISEKLGMSDNSTDNSSIRSDLKQKLDLMNLEEMRRLTIGLENEFTKDENKAKMNVDNIEKQKIIEYINLKYMSRFELNVILKNLNEKSTSELRDLVKDLEFRYESQETAKQNMAKVEKKFIMDFINLKCMQDKTMCENYLDKFFKIPEPKIPFGGGIHDYLAKKDKDMLIDICLGINLYHMKQTGSGEIDGNTHGYLHTLSEHQLRDYIMNECKEHPEINSTQRLEELLKDYKNLKPDLRNYSEVNKFLNSLNREELLKLSYATEKFHKKLTHTENHMGGFHDYIWRLSDVEIREVIMKLIKQHKELNLATLKSMTKDEHSLTLLHNDILSNISEHQKEGNVTIHTNIKNIIKNSDRKDLLNILTKLLDKIGLYDNKFISHMKFDKMSIHHVRKFIKNLIRRHHEELNREELFDKL